MIVGDSSAIIALSVVGCLEYTNEKFKQLCVPTAVYTELTKLPKHNADKLKEFLQDKVVPVREKRFKTLWLGDGESEAIDLYFELKSDLLLVDDQRAKNFARMNNIHTIGSIGVMLLAKEDGIVKDVKSLLEKLLLSGIYLHEKVIDEVLKKAGEKV